MKNVENINARIKDTAEVIKPLDWWSSTSISHPDCPVEVKSIQYRSPTSLNTTGCGPVIFQFFNSYNQPAGDALFIPGQTSHACVDFHNETVAGYAGLTLPLPAPTGFFAGFFASVLGLGR